MDESSIPKLPIPTMPHLLGYLAPGGTIIVSVLLIERVGAESAALNYAPLTQLLQLAPSVGPTAGTWDVKFMGVLAVALLAYVLGHVTDSTAKLVIDRLLVFKGYGYPYETLLLVPSDARVNEDKRLAWRTRPPTKHAGRIRGYNRIARDRGVDWPSLSRAFYRGVFLWPNLGLLFGAACGVSAFAGAPIPVSRGLGRVSVALLVYSLFLGFAKYVFDKPLRAISLAPSRPGSFILLYAVRVLFQGPYELPGKLLAKLLKTRRAFDQEFITTFRECYAREFTCESLNAASNNYWMTRMHVTSRSAACAAEAEHYRQMYRFSRNLSVAFYFSFLYAVVWMLYATVPATPWVVHQWLQFGAGMLTLFFASLLFLVHYYYLYVCYYSKFLFRAFVYIQLPHGSQQQ